MHGIDRWRCWIHRSLFRGLLTRFDWFQHDELCGVLVECSCRRKIHECCQSCLSDCKAYANSVQLEVELNSYERVEEWINLPPEV